MDFTDRSGSKVRPALVVSVEEYNSKSPDVLIASITPQTATP
jgi:mRNA-degrading endonuclease toxin of MazEF toxin-antitoxin module